MQLRMQDDEAMIQASTTLEVPRHLFVDQVGRLEYFKQQLPLVMRQQDFRGRKCVLCLPSDSCFVRHVKVPRLSQNKASEKAIRQAAQADLPYPIEEAVFRHIVAGEIYHEGQRMQEVIVVAIPLSTLEAYLHMTHEASLEVIGVNIEPVATVECFAGLFAWANDEERKIMYINLRGANTLAVIAHGSNVVFARNLPLGGRQVNQAIAEGLDVSLEEAIEARQAICNGEPTDYSADEVYRFTESWVRRLSAELEHCLLYYRSAFRPNDVERIIFTGVQALDKRLCQALARRLNLAAQVGDPMMGIRSQTQTNSETTVATRPQPELCVAIGLSLAGALDE